MEAQTTLGPANLPVIPKQARCIRRRQHIWIGRTINGQIHYQCGKCGCDGGKEAA